MSENKGLLDGVVVLDLTRVLAGPYCGAILADMGATVIKVENPKGGDDSRSMGPFVNDNSVYFANFNRSKVGCTLNLKDPEAKEIFKEMVKKADIVIENYRPGTMEKLGLGYDVLKEVNPAIIYGAVSGFGHTGPLSKRAGYDIVGQAMGGLMSTTGWPGGKPTRVGTPKSAPCSIASHIASKLPSARAVNSWRSASCPDKSASILSVPNIAKPHPETVIQRKIAKVIRRAILALIVSNRLTITNFSL